MYVHGYKSLAEQNLTAESELRVGLDSQADILVSQTVAFTDKDSGERVQFARAPSDYPVEQNHTTLTKFLERPTLIKTITWTESAFSETFFDPWTLFLSNSYITNKIQNFAYLRGNLKLKIVMNAAPFYYGAMLVSYLPLWSNTPSLTSSSARLVSLSQRPHLWVYPQKGSAGEITLPFLLPFNYLDITSAGAVSTMGQVYLTPYAQLQSANGATSNGVTLQIYAWMEDPQMIGPTYRAALQGGEDEYGNGPVSAPAAAIANVSRRLHDIPVIGKFARATTIGASAVSSIAKLFGWSNVPVIEDVKPFKNLPFHDLASAHISEPTSKFTLDPKAELSVDPSIVGGPEHDELAIASIVQRDTYVTQATWNTTDAVGTLYFSASVDPYVAAFSGTTVGGTTTIFQTPLAWVSTLFANWHGDIIYRFKIIASKYHQGRLRISWDPVGLTNTSSDTSNILYTKIVDISENDEIEFRVPYLQVLPWSSTNRLPLNQNWSTSVAQTASSGTSNGVITVRCLTNLSAPVDVAPVKILVFVRGADNLEFANPMEMDDFRGVSHISMQSGDEPYEASHQPDNRFGVNFGDPVASLRLLLRRSCKVDCLPLGQKVTPLTDYQGLIFWYQTKYPPPFGYDPYGIYQAKGVETPATTYQFNYSAMTNLEWISAPFVGMRGSTRWHYNLNVDNIGLMSNVSIRRLSNALIGSPDGPQYNTLRVAADSINKVARTYNVVPHDANNAGGVVLNNLNTQTGISAEFPMMSGARFYYTTPANYSRGGTNDGSNTDIYKFQIEVRPNTTANLDRLSITRYVCAGTDYSVSFFLNVPPLYYNTGAGSTPV